MQAILDQIADWLKGMLVDGIMNNLANFETWIIFNTYQQEFPHPLQVVMNCHLIAEVSSAFLETQ